MSVQVLTPDGEAGRGVQLPAEIFDTQVNVPLIHQVVTAQLATARQGTHSAKTRGQVRGGGRKPWRQKGTGRARQGSLRAPQFTGGGVVHGPTPRSYAKKVPKKMKAAALRGALSDRARGGRIHVVTGLVESEMPSTKDAAAALRMISARRHILVVLGRDDEVTWRSLRNVPGVHLLVPDQVNTYDVLVCDDVVFTERAFGEFLAHVGKGAIQVTATETEKKSAETPAAAPAADADADTVSGHRVEEEAGSRTDRGSQTGSEQEGEK